jgi:hypothetical protein
MDIINQAIFVYHAQQAPAAQVEIERSALLGHLPLALEIQHVHSAQLIK